MTTRMKFLVAAICLWCFSIFTDVRPDFSKEQLVKAELVQLYSGTSSGKYSHLEFIAVYEDQNGRRFDREISPAFYSMAQVGSTYDLEVRPELIYSEYRQGLNVAWSFGSEFLYFVTYITAFVFSVIICLPKSVIDWMNSDIL
ncbi:hypothetical protein PS49_80 [Aeromonas phage PS49]